MITAVDSSVIGDVVGRDPTFMEAAVRALALAENLGQLVICDVVWAEASSPFSTAEAAALVFREMHFHFDPCTVETSETAGRAWRAYRARGGPRDHLIPDFLIGAHALVQADRLLTRDSAFQRRNFPALSVIDPLDA